MKVTLFLLAAMAALLFVGCSENNSLVLPQPLPTLTVSTDSSADFGVENIGFDIKNTTQTTATGVRVRLEVKDGDDTLTITSDNFESATYPVAATMNFLAESVFMERNEGPSWKVVGLTSAEGYLVGDIAPGELIILILNYGP